MASTASPTKTMRTRFIFFSKAAVELARRLTPSPQILHVHDWAAALVPVYVRAHRLPFATVLTIHHLAEQGSFWGLDFRLTNLHERFFTLRGVEFFGNVISSKAEFLFADKITTVSEHLQARDANAGGRLRTRRRAARKCVQANRNFARRRLRTLEPGNRQTSPGELRFEHPFGVNKFAAMCCLSGLRSGAGAARAGLRNGHSRGWRKRVSRFSCRFWIGC